MFNLKRYFKSQLFINIVSNFLFKGLGIILSFISIPITIKYLGKESYSFWTLILSIMSWISNFDIGLGNSLKNSIAQKISRNKNNEIKMEISSAYFSIIIISIIFVILMILSIDILNLKKLLKIDFLSKKRVNLILSINIIFIGINFILSICNSIFYGAQKSYLASINTFIFQVLNFISLLFLLILENKTIEKVSYIYGFSLLISNLMTTFYFFKKNKELKPNFLNISLKKIKGLLNVGGKIFIMQICGLIIFSTDNFIISYFLGVSKIAEYSITIKLFSIFTILFSILLAPLLPSITKAYSENKKKWIKKIIKKIKLIFILILFLTIIFIFSGSEMIKYWTLRELNPPFILITLAGISSLLTNFNNLYLTILMGINKFNLIMYLSLFQAILNLLLSYIFIKYLNLGITGVIGATCICLSVGSLILPIYLKKIFN